MRPYALGNYQIDGLAGLSCPSGFQLQQGMCHRSDSMPIPPIWEAETAKPSATVVTLDTPTSGGGGGGLGPTVAIFAAMAGVGLLAVLALRSSGSRRPVRLKRAWGW